MKELKTRIKELRNNYGLTLKELAKDLDLRDNTLSQYENDKREASLGTMERIANYFNVSLDYLLKNSDIPNYEFTDEKSAIELLKKIDNNEIHYFNLALNTLADLAIWTSKNHEKFEKDGKYNQLLNAAYNLVSTTESELKAFNWFSKIQKSDRKLINEITNELELIDNNDWKGASLNEINEFIQESKRVPYELIDILLKVLKKFNDNDISDENNYSLDDKQITKIAKYISSMNGMPLIKDDSSSDK